MKKTGTVTENRTTLQRRFRTYLNLVTHIPLHQSNGSTVSAKRISNPNRVFSCYFIESMGLHLKKAPQMFRLTFQTLWNLDATILNTEYPVST